MNHSNHPIRTVRSERFLTSQITFASLFSSLSLFLSLFFPTPAPPSPLSLSSSPLSSFLFATLLQSFFLSPSSPDRDHDSTARNGESSAHKWILVPKAGE